MLNKYYFTNKEKDILSRLNELNYDKTPNRSENSPTETKSQNHICDYDTFMFELEEYEKISTQKIKEMSNLKPLSQTSADVTDTHSVSWFIYNNNRNQKQLVIK